MTTAGLWCDVVAVAGRFLLISEQGNGGVEAHDEDGTRRWRCETAEPLWYLHAAALNDGLVCAIGNGQRTGTLQWVIADATGAVRTGQVAGLISWGQCLEGAGDHWRGAVQLNPSTWQRLTIWPTGLVERGPVQPVPTWLGGDGSTSQGFLQMIDGEPVWSDPHRWLTIDGHLLTLPVRAGDAACGQVEGGAGWAKPGGFYARVIDGETPGPRMAQAGERYAVCAWTYPSTNTLAILAPPYPVPPPEPPAEAVDIAPFPSHFYAACYKDAALRAPSNVIFAAEPLMAPITGPAIVGTFRKTLDFAIGWVLGIEDIEATSAAALAAKTVKDLPVYAYLGGAVPEARVDWVDVPLLQAYRGLGCETAAAILSQLRADLARCAYARVGLAVDLTDRTLPGVGGWPEADRVAFLVGIADLCRQIQPAAVFAWAWDRREPQAGISSSPVITEQWRRFVSAIPPAPVAPDPEPPPPQPPEESPMPPYDESLVFAFNDQVKATYAEAGRDMDAQYPVWIARTMYDYCAGMAWRLSAAKHLRELRAALGLPPFP